MVVSEFQVQVSRVEEEGEEKGRKRTDVPLKVKCRRV